MMPADQNTAFEGCHRYGTQYSLEWLMQDTSNFTLVGHVKY